MAWESLVVPTNHQSPLYRQSLVPEGPPRCSRTGEVILEQQAEGKREGIREWDGEMKEEGATNRQGREKEVRLW